MESGRQAPSPAHGGHKFSTNLPKSTLRTGKMAELAGWKILKYRKIGLERTKKSPCRPIFWHIFRRILGCHDTRIPKNLHFDDVLAHFFGQVLGCHDPRTPQFLDFRGVIFWPADMDFDHENLQSPGSRTRRQSRDLTWTPQKPPFR